MTGNASEAKIIRPTLRGHLAICRPDHWVKNVFMIPGIIVAMALDEAPAASWTVIAGRILLGAVAICLIVSSNYVINELLDSPTDRKHPTKRHRPVPSGLVNIPLAYVQWVVLMALGLGVSWLVSTSFAVTMLVLLLMACIYNIRPLRTKDVPFLDVLSEAVNNPLRMLAGWYLINPTAVVPISLLFSYWMIGGYFMALKRFAELRQINQRDVAVAYRKSFKGYTEELLLAAIVFYASASMLFLGVFMMRYRLELILATPVISWVMGLYFHMAFQAESPVQAPEKLYKSKHLVLAVAACCVLIGVLLYTDVPLMHRLFQPTLEP